MPKKVTIYTTNNCASCAMVKKYLASKNQDYEEVNLDERPELRQKIIELSGQMSVPVTVITDTDNDKSQPEIAVGWNPGKLASAIAG